MIQISGENGGSKAGKRSKQEEAGSSKNGVEKCDSKGEKQDDAKAPEPLKDYIHVRARRGQATDSHSLAERVLTTPWKTHLFLCQCLHNANVCGVWLVVRQEERRSARE